MEAKNKTNNLGDRIKELRLSQKLTQSALAEKLFVSDKVISKWEKDKSIPDVDILLELSDIFDVTIEYLLTGKTKHKIIKGGSIAYKDNGEIAYYMSEEGDRLFTRDEVTTILKKRIDRYQQSVFSKYRVKDAQEMDNLVDAYYQLKDLFESNPISKDRSNTFQIDVVCEHCGKSFSFDAPKQVDVRNDPDTKADILSEDFFIHRCPKCHKLTYHLFPFTYIDENVTIYQGPEDYLEYQFEGAKESPKIVGANSYMDFITIITSFDNGLDYRIAKLYLWFKDIELSKNLENGYVSSSSLVTNSLGDIVSKHRIIDKNNRTQRRCRFDKEMYEEIKETYIDALNEKTYHFFNDRLVSEFLESLKGNTKQEA